VPVGTGGGGGQPGGGRRAVASRVFRRVVALTQVITDRRSITPGLIGPAAKSRPQNPKSLISSIFGERKLPTVLVSNSRRPTALWQKKCCVVVYLIITVGQLGRVSARRSHQIHCPLLGRLCLRKFAPLRSQAQEVPPRTSICFTNSRMIFCMICKIPQHRR
jgi:hypothetical protein